MQKNLLTGEASVGRNSLWRTLFKYRRLYLLLIPGLLHLIIFYYIPMGGLAIAFQDYNPYSGIIGSDWVGLKHFRDVFSGQDIWKLIKNTFQLGIYCTIFNFPFPIIFAVFLNEIKVHKVKKFVQSISFFPSLVSIVVICSMITNFLSPTDGIINNMLASLGFDRHYFMVDPKWYRTIYIFSVVWQNFGYNAIVYFSAIGGISTDLYEAADLDGCGRWKKLWHVTLPGLLPTITTMLILNSGNILSANADRSLLLYNPMTWEVSDVIGTYVYRKGINESNYSYASAVGMFQSVVSLVMVYITNTISRKVNETSLW